MKHFFISMLVCNLFLYQPFSVAMDQLRKLKKEEKNSILQNNLNNNHPLLKPQNNFDNSDTIALMPASKNNNLDTMNDLIDRIEYGSNRTPENIEKIKNNIISSAEKNNLILDVVRKMHDRNCHVIMSILCDVPHFNVETMGDKNYNTLLHLIFSNYDRCLDRTVIEIAEKFPYFVNTRNNHAQTPLFIYLHKQVERRINNTRSDINLSQACEITRNVPETLENSTLKILAHYDFNQTEISYLEKIRDLLTREEKMILSKNDLHYIEN